MVQRQQTPFLADRRELPLHPGHRPLVLVSWNIHSCVGLDSRFAPERTAQLLASLGADVIGLQEIGWHHRGEPGFDQFAYLSRALGLSVVAAPTKQHGRAHYGNALLTRLPVLTQQRIDLSLPGREPRGAVLAVLDCGGQPIRCVNAHLGLGPRERTVQIGRLLSILGDDPALPTILMGDLNEWRLRSVGLRQLLQRFPDQAAPRSFPVRLPALRLDRIFVSSGLQLASFAPVRTPLSHHASDHLPLRAVIGIPAGAE
jgi:endonuclease/exonuclease/phosphatase family metal-dependent hydrolase